MSDTHYVETSADHTAGGLPVPPYRDLACQETLVAGHSSVFMCALFAGHRGPHESAGGVSWEKGDLS